VPLLGVNHLRAHVEAAQLEHGELEPPLIALVVSGGHTSIVVMDEQGGFRSSVPPSTTPPGRRSTRSPGSSGSAIRAGRDRPARPRRRPEAFASPGR
jgi:hypothetical protein